MILKNIKKRGNIVAIIQARMGSNRLKGKTLMNICGEPLLLKVIKQVNSSNLIDKLIIATTDLKEDEPVKILCEKYGYEVFCGSKSNVLSRYFKASEVLAADIIVRITGDCPLITPDTIDEVIEKYLRSSFDYVSNTNPYSRSEGQDVEVFSHEILKFAFLNASEKTDLEHVTLFLKKK